MKIHLKGKPKQFGFTKVVCLDSIMSEMLRCVPDTPLSIDAKHISAARKAGNLFYVHTFYSGAMLKVTPTTNEYFIHSFALDGRDVLSAIEELKMLDALRLAKEHFLAMKLTCSNPEVEKLSLRVTQY